MIDPDNAAVTKARISHVVQNYLRAEKYAVANGHLIDGQAGLSVAEIWGGGLVAAVDGTRFVVPVRSSDVRRNPKLSRQPQRALFIGHSQQNNGNGYFDGARII